MLDVVLLVLAVVAAAVLALVVTGMVRVVLLRRRHRGRGAALAPEHHGRAVLFGVASDGRTQVRGVGTLVLAADEVAFLTLVAGRDLHVRRDDVTSVSLTRTFMGRGTGADLLLVTWETNGLGDAAAFSVEDPTSWRDRL